MNILIKDNTIGGETKNSFTIESKEEYLTIRELLKLRIFKEVEVFNNSTMQNFRTLVQPTNAEETLNGFTLNDKSKIDAEKQYYLAMNAFQENRFFILLNKKQVDSLDEKIKLHDNLELVFIKLTPLVGG